jgi:HlyD family secretion protein
MSIRFSVLVRPATVAIAAAVVASICGPLSVGKAEAADPTAATDMSVSVAAAQRVCFSNILQMTGTLVPRNEILVRPDREGLQIAQVLVETGDSVISGQVLARLTPMEGQTGQGLAVQAPAAGTVIRRNAVIGTLASARAEPMFRIAGGGDVELAAETPTKTLANIAPQQAAKIEIVGVGELSGKVRLVPAVVDTTTQLAQVRVAVDSDPRLRPGVFGLAKIDLGSRCGPAVPLSAVLYSSEGALVQVVRAHRIETRRVTIGLVANGQAEVREGISAGDPVVARAGAFVREGDHVRTVPVEQALAR